jgi:hypothetical protein
MKTITAAGLRADALAAYNAGTLTAQHPTNSPVSSLVSPDGCQTCGIGASVPLEFRALAAQEHTSWIYADSQFLGLRYSNLDAELRKELGAISRLHDAWHFAARAPAPNHDETARLEAQFLAHLS